jgi:hypothetical protein
LKARVLVAAATLAGAVPTLAAPPGSADNFLARAERLKAKGPLALFDSDYGRLKTEATAVGKAIGDDRIAAQRAGKPILYCSPNARAELGSFEFIRGIEAIAPAERSRMSLKEAMIRVLQRKYPCRR